MTSYNYQYENNSFYLIEQNVSTQDKVRRPNRLGTSVLISPDGNTAFTSCPTKTYTNVSSAYHEKGQVYVLVKSGTTWSYQAELRSVDTILSGVDQGSHNHFGTSLCCSTDGNLLFTGNKHQHVFHYDTVDVNTIEDAQSGGNYYIKITTASPHDFLVGDELRISESYYYTPPRRNAVFTVQSLGSNWVILDGVYVNGTTVPAHTKIGRSMRYDIGDVIVYERSGTNWSFKYKISDGITSSMNIVKHPHTGDTFGYSVSCSSDGSVLAVGSPTKESNYTGEIYIFIQDGNTWEYKSKLSDGISITNHYRLGSSVHVSASGTKLIAGTCAQSKLGRYPTVQYEGEAWVADLNKTSGAISNETALVSLVQPSLYTGASTMKLFGKNVKISSNGTRAFVASSITLTVGSLTYGNSGDIHIFDYNGSTWSHTINLSTLISFNAGNNPAIGGIVPILTSSRPFLTDAFDISDDGNNVLVGASTRATSYNSNSYMSGEVFSFRYKNSAWQFIEGLIGSINAQQGILYGNEKFGSAVSASFDCSACIIGHRERRQNINGIATYMVGDAYMLGSKIAPVMTFPLISSATYGSSSFSLTSTCIDDSDTVSAPNLGPITYSSSDSNVISIAGSTASIQGSGSCTITASYAGNSVYAASSISQTINVDTGNVVFSFQAIPALTFGDSDFTLTATGTNDSGASIGSLIFSSSDSNVISVSGNTASIQNTGTCTLSVSSSDSNYNGISTQTVSVAKADQSISNFNFSTVKYITDGSFQLNAISNSTLTPIYSSSDTSIITISGSTASLISAGTCIITASFISNSNYNACQAYLNVSVEKNYQLISYTSGVTTIGIGQQTGFTFSADSGLAVSVSYTESTPGVINYANNNIEGLSEGTATFTLSQTGNANYRAAAAVQLSFTVQAAHTSAHPGLYDTGNIANFNEAPIINPSTLENSIFLTITDPNFGLMAGDPTDRLKNYSDLSLKYREEYTAGTLQDDFYEVKKQLRRTMRQMLQTDRTIFSETADIQNLIKGSDSNNESLVDSSREIMVIYPDPDKTAQTINMDNYTIDKNFYIDIADDEEITITRGSYSAAWKMSSSALLINNEVKALGDTVQMDDIEITIFMFGSVGGGEGSGGGSGTADPIMTPLFGLPYQIPSNNGFYLLFDNKDPEERLIVNTRIQCIDEDYFVNYCNNKWHRKTPECVAYMDKIAIFWNNEWKEYDFPSDLSSLDAKIEKRKLNLPMYEQKNLKENILHYNTQKHGRISVILKKYNNIEMRNGISIEGFGLTKDNCYGAIVSCPVIKNIKLKKLKQIPHGPQKWNAHLVPQKFPVKYDNQDYLIKMLKPDRNHKIYRVDNLSVR